MNYTYATWEILFKRMKQRKVHSSEVQPNLCKANHRIQKMTHPDGEVVYYT